MSQGLLCALALLAVVRVAHMLALEDGPFDAFSRIRERVGQGTWVGRGLHCALCLGFWAAFAMAWLLRPADPAAFLLAWLGLAGGQLLIHKAVYHD